MTELTDDTAKGKPANPPAFPRPHLANPGMSLRDWFAGQALTGIVSDNDRLYRLKELLGNPCVGAAQSAYEFADAMLVVRGDA